MALADLTREIKDKKVVTMSMADVRNAAGSRRLGKHVRAQIEATLRDEGIATIPENLPASQNTLIRLYDEGSDLGRFIFALSHPEQENDDVLRTFLSQKAKPRK